MIMIHMMVQMIMLIPMVMLVLFAMLECLVELYVLRPMSGGEKVLVGRNYIKVFDRSKRSTFVHNSICDFPKLKFTGASVLPVQDYKIIKEIDKSKILKIAIFQKGTVPR